MQLIRFWTLLLVATIFAVTFDVVLGGLGRPSSESSSSSSSANGHGQRAGAWNGPGGTRGNQQQRGHHHGTHGAQHGAHGAHNGAYNANGAHGAHTGAHGANGAYGAQPGAHPGAYHGNHNPHHGHGWSGAPKKLIHKAQNELHSAEKKLDKAGHQLENKVGRHVQIQ